MYRRLSKEEKLQLVKKIRSGAKVSEVCKGAGISRTILYKWLKSSDRSLKKSAHWKKLPTIVENKIVKVALKNPSFSPRVISKLTNVSQHGAWNVLKRNGLNTKQARDIYIFNNGRSLIRSLGVNDKIAMMRRLELGDKVSAICKDFRVSRDIFYKWLNRYQKAQDSAKREALESLRPKGENHWRFVPGREELVLKVILEHPEYSVHKISKVLFQKENKHILSSYGVHTLLTRLNLNTYQRRLVYAKAQQVIITPAPQVAEGWRIPIFGKIPSLSALAPPGFFNKLISSKFFIPLVSIIIIGFIFSVILSNLSYGQGIAGKIGILFSFIALFFGMFFFIYSLKYYLTIAIVLSFSRRSEEDRGDKGNKGADGLKADLSSVILQRYPFVSIHIATYNEKTVIERLLKAASSLGYDNYEIVIIDDSNDETTLIIQEYLKAQNSKLKTTTQNSNLEEGNFTLTTVEVRPGVTLKHLHRSSREGFKGGALREALKHTDPRAEFIMVLDADFIPYPDTIVQFLKYFQATSSNQQLAISHQPSAISENELKADQLEASGSRIAAIQGYQWHVLNKSENWITRGVRSEYSGSYVIERSGEEIYEGLKQISGSVYMIRRDVLDSIGWGTSLTEDFQLTLKLYEKGYKVVYTPYIQAPSECVSTIERLVRQRMRWAEGHSHNIRKMFTRLLFGRWITQGDSDFQGDNDQLLISNDKSNPNNQMSNKRIGHFGIGHSLGIRNYEIRNSQRKWVPSPLTLPEKLEFLYLSPYYLQAAFFILGTLSWFIAEVVFKVRLPFWTEVWGWSLVFTNFLALPLMNMVGLFMEEADERDYFGLFSFIALSYITAPFQGYAALKGFLAHEEGPWFRTPKTGKITDAFMPGRLYRWVRGVFGRPSVSLINADSALISAARMSADFSANQRFNNFRIKRKTVGWVGSTILSIFLMATLTLTSLTPFIPQIQKAQASETFITIGGASKQPARDNRDTGEITTPRSIHRTTLDGKVVEFIFHREPRVRIKIDHKEIEITTEEAKGLGKANPKRAIMYGSKKVVYEDIFPDIDLEYKVAGALEERFVIKKKAQIKSIDQRIRLQDVSVLSNGRTFGFYDKEGNGIYVLKEPYMFEEKNKGQRNYDLEMKLEKEMADFKLSKVLKPEALAWLSDPKRVFPIILDPDVILATNISEEEVEYGGNQRKLYYYASFNKYFAIFNDAVPSGGACTSVNCTVYYSYCDEDQTADDDCSTVGGSGWSAAVDLNSADDENHNPSLWFDVSADVIWVAWGDDSSDAIEFRSIDPVDGQVADTLGSSICVTADILAANGQFISDVVGIVEAGDDATSYVFHDVEVAGSNDLQKYTTPAASCATNPTFTAINFNVGNADSRAVGVPADTTTDDIQFVWQDSAASTGIQSSVFDGSTFGTEFAIDSTNEATSFSVVKEADNDIWIFATDGTATASIYRCATACTSNGQVTENNPWTGATNLNSATLTLATTANDLVLSVIKDTSEQAFFKRWDAATNAIEADACNTTDGCPYGFSSDGDDLGHISSMYSLADITKAGVVTRAGTAGNNYEFATVPERSLILLLLVPFLPNTLARFRRRRRIK